jgi:hypothetical protein
MSELSKYVRRGLHEKIKKLREADPKLSHKLAIYKAVRILETEEKRLSSFGDAVGRDANGN